MADEKIEKPDINEIGGRLRSVEELRDASGIPMPSASCRQLATPSIWYTP
jgi:hypothetical protein